MISLNNQIIDAPLNLKEGKAKTNLCIKLLLYVLLFFSCSFSYSQNDSIVELKNNLVTFKKNNKNFEKQTTYVDMLNLLSWSLRYSQLDSMLTLAEEANLISENLGYEAGKTSATLNFAGYYLHSGNADQSIVHLSKILNKSDNKVSSKQLLETYNLLGQAYFAKGDYPDSYRAFKNALDIAAETSNKRLLGRQYLNLGVMFSLLNSHKLAEEYFDEGLRIFKDHKDDPIEAKLSSNLAFSLIKKGEWKRAIPLLNYSIAVFKNLRMPSWLAYSYSTMGDVYLEQENYEQAETYFKKSLDIHKEIEDIKGRADTYQGCAKSKLGLKEFTQAESYITKSLDLYNKINLKTGIESCFALYYKLYKQTQQPLMALQYLEKYDSLNAIIAKEENSTNITMLITKLEYDKEKRLEHDIHNEKLAQQRRYILWFIFLIMIFLLISLLIYRSNSRIKDLNEELKVKTQILSKNEGKLNVINKNQEKLFSIVGHDLRGPIVSLKELVNITLENESGEVIFKKYAPKLHKDLDNILFTLDNLLNWGQTQMRGAITLKENISIVNVINNVIPLFEKNIQEKKLQILNNISQDMKVFADYNHIDLVLRNIINNAVKFTPESGTIWINGIITENFLTIEIKDNGVGMSLQTLSKIMDNYVHYSSFGTNMERGTGLGLQLSQEMIKKNNGTIRVESQENKGTSFFIKLPLSQQDMK